MTKKAMMRNQKGSLPELCATDDPIAKPPEPGSVEWVALRAKEFEAHKAAFIAGRIRCNMCEMTAKFNPLK